MEQERVLSASGFNAFLGKVFMWMFMGLFVTMVSSYMVLNSPTVFNLIFGNQLVFFGLIIAEFGLVIYLSTRVLKIPKAQAVGFFLLYAALNGMTLASIFLIYAGSELTTAFLVTSIVFASMAAYGYLTKNDLSGFRTFFMMGLIGIIAASVVNIFLRSDGMTFIISLVGVAVFAGLTAYDIQKMKTYYIMGMRDNHLSLDGLAVSGALSLYLDFINLFLSILRLMRRR